jgi:SM-20-related protein
MNCLDLDAFRKTPLIKQPFEHLVVPDFVREAARARINADYPQIRENGSFPIGRLSYGASFRQLLDELKGEEFRHAFEEKFGIDLAGRPSTITVRRRCHPKDGQIHTDSKSKIITVLIYMNPSWEDSRGRLRLLRCADSLDDVITEVPPIGGTLVAFRRSDNSWHGHASFSGERRVIQFNWVNSKGDRRIAMLRHQVSAPFKRLLGLFHHAPERIARTP